MKININNNNNDFKKKIISEIINKKDINEFNSLLNSFFIDINKDKPIIITNSLIIFCLTKKFNCTRDINYLLKQKKPVILNKNENINYLLYYYTLLYIYVNNKLINMNSSDVKLIYSIEEYFKLIIIFYKSDLLSFPYVINIFKFYLNQINNNLSIPQKIKIINNYIYNFRKFIKEVKLKNNNKETNKLIIEEISFFFNILNDNNNYYLIYYLRKEGNLFLLLEIMIENDFLLNIIEHNFTKLLIHNFMKEHYDYFYKIIIKILMKFNKLNPKTFEKTNFNNNYLSINKNFSYLLKIVEIFKNVIDYENNLIRDKSCYYCDKGFILNNYGKRNNIGFKIKDILYNNKIKNNSFCILFTFLLKNNKDNKNNQIIFSINDSKDNEYLTLFIKENNIYLNILAKKQSEIILLKDFNYNYYYSFFFFYDKNQIKVNINNKEVLSQIENEFNIPDKFQVIVGDIKSNKNETSFTGIINPILLFELKKGEGIYEQMKESLLKIKNNYYLIGEKYFNYNNCIYDIKEYYGLYKDKADDLNIKEILNNINNLIIYINPDVVLNSFDKKTKIYKDYNNYIRYYNNNETINYFYEFSVIPSIEQELIIPFKDNNIFNFYKNNNGLNFNILIIELLYNYILLLNENSNCIILIKEKIKELFILM